MSTKQSKADSIYATGTDELLSRKAIVSEISAQLNISTGYAATLYNNSRKAASPTTRTTVTNHKPITNSLTPFTRKSLRTIRKDLEADLEAFFAARAMSVDVGYISYSDDKFTANLTVNTGSKEDGQRQEFTSLARLYGLDADDYHKVFTNERGDKFRIDSMSSRSRKYPVIATRLKDDSQYKFTINQVKQYLNK